MRKLWSYFIPVPPPATTVSAMRPLYKRSGYKVRPVVTAILKHPRLYTGPRMMKPPVVQVAGMHRARKRPVDTDSWSWIAELDGQRLFFPPNVAGWDDNRWLDTSTLRGRWIAANYTAMPYALDPDVGAASSARPGQARRPRARVLGKPDRDASARQALRSSPRPRSPTPTDWKRDDYPVLIVNALRMLVAVCPDYQTSDMSCSCNEFSRAAPSAAPSPRRGTACPRSSPACRSRPAAASTAAPS